MEIIHLILPPGTLIIGVILGWILDRSGKSRILLAADHTRDSCEVEYYNLVHEDSIANFVRGWVKDNFGTTANDVLQNEAHSAHWAVKPLQELLQAKDPDDNPDNSAVFSEKRSVVGATKVRYRVRAVLLNAGSVPGFVMNIRAASGKIGQHPFELLFDNSSFPISLEPNEPMRLSGTLEIFSHQQGKRPDFDLVTKYSWPQIFDNNAQEWIPQIKLFELMSNGYKGLECDVPIDILHNRRGFYSLIPSLGVRAPGFGVTTTCMRLIQFIPEQKWPENLDQGDHTTKHCARLDRARRVREEDIPHLRRVFSDPPRPPLSPERGT